MRLHATFATFAPTQRAGVPFDVKLDCPSSLLDLIDALKIPLETVHLAILNGRVTHDRTHPLKDGDRIGLFPPVGGG